MALAAIAAAKEALCREDERQREGEAV